MSNLRKLIYIVVRDCPETKESVVISSYTTYEGADWASGAYQQEFIDRGVPDKFVFRVVPCMHYNE